MHVVSALFAGVLLEGLALLRAHPHIVMDEHHEGAAEERCAPGSPLLRLCWHTPLPWHSCRLGRRGRGAVRACACLPRGSC